MTTVVIVYFPDGSRDFRYPTRALERGDVVGWNRDRYRVVDVMTDGDQQSVRSSSTRTISQICSAPSAGRSSSRRSSYSEVVSSRPISMPGCRPSPMSSSVRARAAGAFTIVMRVPSSRVRR